MQEDNKRPTSVGEPFVSADILALSDDPPFYKPIPVRVPALGVSRESALP